jgi:hypothetical protein
VPTGVKVVVRKSTERFFYVSQKRLHLNACTI